MSYKHDARDLVNVIQVIECNDIDAVNVFLKSGQGILLNSYKNMKYGRKPTYCIGLFKEDETESNYMKNEENER